MKDLFSLQAQLYATFRPTYPQALYDYILQHVKTKQTALDCATGNGQVARHLAKHFHTVFATDISQNQLDYAPAADNIFYSLQLAEKTTFQDHQFDLITVGQALHWFQQEAFYNEVKRITKPDGILAVWTYNLLTFTPAIDTLILHFYKDVVGKYWDKARKLIETNYRTLTFPFKEIQTPTFLTTLQWTLPHLEGYLKSWSATQQYIQHKGKDPVPELINKIKQHWAEGTKETVSFPITLRLFSMEPASGGASKK